MSRWPRQCQIIRIVRGGGNTLRIWVIITYSQIYVCMGSHHHHAWSFRDRKKAETQKESSASRQVVGHSARICAVFPRPSKKSFFFFSLFPFPFSLFPFHDVMTDRAWCYCVAAMTAQCGQGKCDNAPSVTRGTGKNHGDDCINYLAGVIITCDFRDSCVIKVWKRGGGREESIQMRFGGWNIFPPRPKIWICQKATSTGSEGKLKVFSTPSWREITQVATQSHPSHR